MPMMPDMPASAGGAGMGNFKNAKIKPTINPVISAMTTVFIFYDLFH